MTSDGFVAEYKNCGEILGVFNALALSIPGQKCQRT
jgi:hypothetical protein